MPTPATAAVRARTALRIVLAWAPFAVLWALFNIISFGAEPLPALRGSIATIGSAALLSVAVWFLARAMPWPARLRPGFYVAHVAAALAYSAAWLVLSIVLGALVNGDSMPGLVEVLRPFFAWRMLTGVWLYGLVAGVAYVIQVREALRAQQEAAVRAEALASTAQLEALRARLNPHFFFNALNALSGLIHRDADLADDALDRIGQLLRRSLAADPGRRMPLAEEWRFTSDYLDLERLRLGDRLRVRADLAESTLGAMVPPFTLQPLVENAVLHAVAPAEGGGTIAVSARAHGDRLVLTVEDDGTRGAVPTEGSGHGLELLRRRLDALYGERATLEAGPLDGHGWRATIVMPLEAG